MRPFQYGKAFFIKQVRVTNVHDDRYLNSTFIEGVHGSICRGLRRYISAKVNTDLTIIAFWAQLFLAVNNEYSCKNEALASPGSQEHQKRLPWRNNLVNSFELDLSFSRLRSKKTEVAMNVQYLFQLCWWKEAPATPPTVCRRRFLSQSLSNFDRLRCGLCNRTDYVILKCSPVIRIYACKRLVP